MFDNQSSLSRYDVIVIGSGISGLVTSLILAKEGKKVALFEKDSDIAPLIRPYKRKDCACSPGLHIIGWMDEGEIISSFFKYLDISDGIETESKSNGFGDIIIGAKKYHFPKGYVNIEKSLLTYFPESKIAVKNYLRLVREINEQTFLLNHSLTPKLNQNKFGVFENFTLKECLEKYQASQELIDLLGLFNYLLIGSKADEVPFNIHAFVLGGYYQSPGYLTLKGISRLLSNFKRELIKYGVNLFINSEIDEILTDGNKNAIGVKTLNGDQYFASTIIAAFNPKLLNEKIKSKALRPIYRQRLNEIENTFGLYVAFFKIEDNKRIEVDNFIYYNSKLDINLGAIINYTNGNSILCIFLADNRKKPIKINDRNNYAKEKFSVLENVVYDLIPALQGKMVLIDYLKPWSFERYTNTVNGSAYGVKHTVNSFGIQQRVPIHGLFLVGQAILPGFMGSMISGFNLASELLETDNVWSRVINQ